MASKLRHFQYCRQIFAGIPSFAILRSQHIQSVKMQEQDFGESRIGRTRPTTNMGQLQEKFGWMSRKTKCFGVRGKDLHVLTEPVQFYETFKAMTYNAKERIVIASLYLGTGDLEKSLVDSIGEACERACRERNQEFEVHVLLDFTRGSRGGETSSRTMLIPLLEKYPQYVHVHLYHTPDLRGLLKKLVPERYDETVGLTHMKVYLADNSFIISGANLSDSYFTNRQDRYILFKQCEKLSDFFCNLVKTVSGFSFLLHQNNTTALAPGLCHHPYEGEDDGSLFKSAAREKLLELLLERETVQNQRTVQNQGSVQEQEVICDCDTVLLDSENDTENSVSENLEIDTFVFPLIQMGPFGVTTDEEVTMALMERAAIGDQVLMASGYFNLTEQYMNTILHESKGTYKILTASPEANGFHSGKGISGYVPAAYTHILKQFYEKVMSLGQEYRICLQEYHREHWTFHGKGLWYYLPSGSLPVMTFIGSPNFGYRSVYRDLECQVAVVTQNQSLREELREEHERMYQLSTLVTDDTLRHPVRHVPLWVRFVTSYIRKFF